MPIRLAYEPIAIGDTIQVIDGPDAGAVFAAEVVYSGTVGVRTCNDEIAWFARQSVCKTTSN